MESQEVGKNSCCCVSCFDSLLEKFMKSSLIKNQKLRTFLGLIILCLSAYEIYLFVVNVRTKFESFINHSDYEVLIIGSPTNSQSEGEYNDSYYQTIVKEGYKKDCGKIRSAEKIVEVTNSDVISKILISFLCKYILLVSIEIIMNSILLFTCFKESDELKFARLFTNFYIPFIKLLTNLIVAPILNISYSDCLDGPIYLYNITWMYFWGIVYVVLNNFITNILIKKLKNKIWILILLFVNLPVTILTYIIRMIVKLLLKLHSYVILMWLYSLYLVLFIICVFLFLVGILAINLVLIKNVVSASLIIISFTRMIIVPIVILFKSCCSKCN